MNSGDKKVSWQCQREFAADIGAGRRKKRTMLQSYYGSSESDTDSQDLAANPCDIGKSFQTVMLTIYTTAISSPVAVISSGLHMHGPSIVFARMPQSMYLSTTNAKDIASTEWYASFLHQWTFSAWFYSHSEYACAFFSPFCFYSHRKVQFLLKD